jgi:serine/threonine protein kinase
MTFLLSSQNVFEYLTERKICHAEKQQLEKIKEKSSKNFNLLVRFSNSQNLLVKQERHDSEGKTKGDLSDEWQIHELIKKFPQLNPIRSLIAEAIYFDRDRSILIFNYLDDYQDLLDLYEDDRIFPPQIAAALGNAIATVHRCTIDSQECQDFLAQNSSIPINKPPNLMRGLDKIYPDVFGKLTTDGLQFLRLYQLYDSLREAIAQLDRTFDACCLLHNDLKLDNILLHKDWERTPDVRIIDWELSRWGDPAFDLGKLLASYLKLWLSSLTVSTDIDIQTALHLATTPLEVIQPSLVALIKAYLNSFPEISDRFPDFLNRVMQFTGLGLIRKIQAKISYQEPFDNVGICMLQVAKTLLCRPEESIPIVLGTTAGVISNIKSD